MPPKKTNSGASKKTETKKKEKIIEVSANGEPMPILPSARSSGGPLNDESCDFPCRLFTEPIGPFMLFSWKKLIGRFRCRTKHSV